MLTLLGSSDNFYANEIDFSLFSETKIFFTQAYIIGTTERNDLLRSIFIKTREHGGMNVLALSSAFIVKQKLNAIQNLIPYIDVLIGNDSEFKSLYKTYSLSETLKVMSLNNKLNIITVGARGAYIIYKTTRGCLKITHK